MGFNEDDRIRHKNAAYNEGPIVECKYKSAATVAVVMHDSLTLRDMCEAIERGGLKAQFIGGVTPSTCVIEIKK